jgi:uncharacterized damage-inducible protein DinB
MLRELINYTRVADKKAIATFLSADKAMPQAEALFSHILNAQDIWISRVKGIKPRFERFDVHAVNEFSKIHEANMVEIEEILATVNLETIISYSTFSGESFKDPLKDILLHVANHSTYHRAQVASQFKLNNVEPPVTDFIALKRERSI